MLYERILTCLTQWTLSTQEMHFMTDIEHFVCAEKVTPGEKL